MTLTKLLMLILVFFLVEMGNVTAQVQGMIAAEMNISNGQVSFTLKGSTGYYFIKSHGQIVASGYGQGGDIIRGDIWPRLDGKECIYDIECGTTGEDGISFLDGCIVVVTGIKCE